MADDLAAPELRTQLMTRLRELEPDAARLPVVAEALRRLGEDPKLAWRVYAWALLAEHVSESS